MAPVTISPFGDRISSDRLYLAGFVRAWNVAGYNKSFSLVEAELKLGDMNMVTQKKGRSIQKSETGDCVRAHGRISMGLAVLALLSIFSLAGCAPQAQISMLERNIAGLRVENERLSQEVNALKKQVGVGSDQTGQQGPADIRKLVANLGVRLDALESEVLRLNGLVEQLKYQQDQQGQELMSLQQSTGQRQSPAGGFAAVKPQSYPAPAPIQPPVTRSAEYRDKQTEMPAPARPVVQKRPEGEIDLYKKGMELFRQEKFQEAKQVFKAFVKQNPDAPLAANAYFWIGECEYKSNRFEEAILEYQRVISDYPKSNKVPDALLKQGFAFARLGEKDTARIVLKKLLKLYPNTPQAKVARKQLARLK